MKTTSKPEGNTEVNHRRLSQYDFAPALYNEPPQKNHGGTFHNSYLDYRYQRSCGRSPGYRVKKIARLPNWCLSQSVTYGRLSPDTVARTASF